ADACQDYLNHVIAYFAEIVCNALDVRRDLARTREDELDVAARDDETPVLAQTRHIEADGAQRRQRVGQEHALREGEAEPAHDSSRASSSALRTRPFAIRTRSLSTT